MLEANIKLAASCGYKMCLVDVADQIDAVAQEFKDMPAANHALYCLMQRMKNLNDKSYDVEIPKHVLVQS